VQSIFCGANSRYEQGGGSALRNEHSRLKPRQNERGPDSIDERIVGLLRHDARMTLTALARSVSLSRTAVQARIARLERDGVILGYQARIREKEDDRLGAILSLVFSQRPCKPVVAKFRHWPEIEHYYSVTGPVDAYVSVRVKDAEALAELVDRFSALPGVASASSAVMLKAD
jgi:Lrp/AsnC family transcriptional regulator, leucine-responsive regulatory protein